MSVGGGGDGGGGSENDGVFFSRLCVADSFSSLYCGQLADSSLTFLC